VENFRPGVMDRLGLGYADLAHGRDALIYTSLTGFGREGPYAGKSAYDTVIQAYAGLATNQADPETGEPKFLNQTAADKVTALVAAQAMTAALFARERGTGSQHVELSMLDAVVSFLWADAAGNELLLASDHSRPSSFVANFKPFRFVDGWGIATPTSDADFAGMCRALGVDGYDDPRVATITQRNQHRDLVREIMARVYAAAATMTTVEAMQRMEAERVPCGVVLAPAELAEDQHARAIGLLVDDVHPVAGPIRQPRHPTRFSSTPAVLGGPAPMLGEHTDAVLADLGLGARIAELRAKGVVA
jgi:crotonobetainyl-CoA:carnitine CoA-transferase CaiB-like acyl-CoA transferase